MIIPIITFFNFFKSLGIISIEGQKINKVIIIIIISLLRPAQKERGSKLLLSVRPSVWSSVSYIANNSRTRRPVCRNSEWRFPTFDATSRLVSGSKDQRSRSPYPLILSHILRHIFQCELSAYRWLAYFWTISVSICTKTRTQYSNEGPQHCNWAQFSKIAF